MYRTYSSTYWRMEKVVSICVVQYLSKTRHVRLEQEQFTPEAFGVFVIFDVLIEINEYEANTSILWRMLSYPEQISIQRDDLWLEIVWSALLGQRRLQFHVEAKERVTSEVK
jgi:hypothetical protein